VQNPSCYSGILPSSGSFLQTHVTAAVLMLHLIKNDHTSILIHSHFTRIIPIFY